MLMIDTSTIRTCAASPTSWLDPEHSPSPGVCILLRGGASALHLLLWSALDSKLPAVTLLAAATQPAACPFAGPSLWRASTCTGPHPCNGAVVDTKLEPKGLRESELSLPAVRACNTFAQRTPTSLTAWFHALAASMSAG